METRNITLQANTVQTEVILKEIFQNTKELIRIHKWSE